MDEGIDKVNTTIDEAVRKELFQKVWERLDELHPVVALSVPDELYGARKDLMGLEELRDGRLNYLGDLTLGR